MASEKSPAMTEQEAIAKAEQELSTSRYLSEISRNPGMSAIHNNRCAWLSVLVRLAKKALAEEVNRAVRCSYCDPSSQDYNPCWLCKKGGTAHDVEHCHKTNYGDYEPMQPHCHLCGRKLQGGLNMKENMTYNLIYSEDECDGCEGCDGINCDQGNWPDCPGCDGDCAIKEE